MRRTRTESPELRVQVVEACGSYGVAISHLGGRGMVVSARHLPALLRQLEEAAERIRRKQATAPARSPWQA